MTESVTTATNPMDEVREAFKKQLFKLVDACLEGDDEALLLQARQALSEAVVVLPDDIAIRDKLERCNDRYWEVVRKNEERQALNHKRQMLQVQLNQETNHLQAVRLLIQAARDNLRTPGEIAQDVTSHLGKWMEKANGSEVNLDQMKRIAAELQADLKEVGVSAGDVIDVIAPKEFEKIESGRKKNQTSDTEGALRAFLQSPGDASLQVVMQQYETLYLGAPTNEAAASRMIALCELNLVWKLPECIGSTLWIAEDGHSGKPNAEKTREAYRLAQELVDGLDRAHNVTALLLSRDPGNELQKGFVDAIDRWMLAAQLGTVILERVRTGLDATTYSDPVVLDKSLQALNIKKNDLEGRLVQKEKLGEEDAFFKMLTAVQRWLEQSKNDMKQRIAGALKGGRNTYWGKTLGINAAEFGGVSVGFEILWERMLAWTVSTESCELERIEKEYLVEPNRERLDEQQIERILSELLDGKAQDVCSELAIHTFSCCRAALVRMNELVGELRESGEKHPELHQMLLAQDFLTRVKAETDKHDTQLVDQQSWLYRLEKITGSLEDADKKISDDVAAIKKRLDSYIDGQRKGNIAQVIALLLWPVAVAIGLWLLYGMPIPAVVESNASQSGANSAMTIAAGSTPTPSIKMSPVAEIVVKDDGKLKDGVIEEYRFDVTTALAVTRIHLKPANAALEVAEPSVTGALIKPVDAGLWDLTRTPNTASVSFVAHVTRTTPYTPTTGLAVELLSDSSVITHALILPPTSSVVVTVTHQEGEMVRLPGTVARVEVTPSVPLSLSLVFDGLDPLKFEPIGSGQVAVIPLDHFVITKTAVITGYIVPSIIPLSQAPSSIAMNSVILNLREPRREVTSTLVVSGTNVRTTGGYPDTVLAQYSITNTGETDVQLETQVAEISPTLGSKCGGTTVRFIAVQMVLTDTLADSTWLTSTGTTVLVTQTQSGRPATTPVKMFPFGKQDIILYDTENPVMPTLSSEPANLAIGKSMRMFVFVTPQDCLGSHVPLQFTVTLTGGERPVILPFIYKQ